MMAIMSSGSPTRPAISAATINTTTMVSPNCASSVRARTTSAARVFAAELVKVLIVCSIDAVCHVFEDEIGGLSIST